MGKLVVGVARVPTLWAILLVLPVFIFDFWF
jgi:hypothetical protein